MNTRRYWWHDREEKGGAGVFSPTVEVVIGYKAIFICTFFHYHLLLKFWCKRPQPSLWKSSNIWTLRLSILCYVGLGFRKWEGPQNSHFFLMSVSLLSPGLQVYASVVAEKGTCGKGRNAFLCQFSGSRSRLVQAVSKHFKGYSPLRLTCCCLSRQASWDTLWLNSVCPWAYRRPGATC